MLPPDEALTAMPAVEVGAADGSRFRGGQALQVAPGGQEGLVRVYDEPGKKFLGVGELTGDGVLAPRRVFQIQEKTP